MTDDRDPPDAALPYPRRERPEAKVSPHPLPLWEDPKPGLEYTGPSFHDRLAQAGLAPELLPENRPRIAPEAPTLAQEPADGPEWHQDAPDEPSEPPWPSWSGWEDVE